MVATTKTQQLEAGTFLGVLEPHGIPVKGTYYSALLMSSTGKRHNIGKPLADKIMG